LRASPPSGQVRHLLIALRDANGTEPAADDDDDDCT
jgi:hypothetical protein